MSRLAVAALIAVCVASAARADLLKPGDAVPSWSLPDQTGKTVNASDLAGKPYLLWFYPRAMTPGCTAEGRQLRDRFADFQKRGVEVLGVSFDTPEENAEFVRAEEFPFRLLSDQKRTLAVAVGAATSKDQGAAARVSYLVGSDGKVRRTYGEVSPASQAAQVLGDFDADANAKR